MADLSITAANVALVSGTSGTGTAGETVTAGQALYLKSADSRLWLADCDDTSATATIKGVALNGASAGQPLAYAESGAVVTIGATTTIGEIYVLSGTAGGVAPEGDHASDDYVSLIGVGVTAANIKLTIVNSGVQVP